MMPGGDLSDERKMKKMKMILAKHSIARPVT